MTPKKCVTYPGICLLLLPISCYFVVQQIVLKSHAIYDTQKLWLILWFCLILLPISYYLIIQLIMLESCAIYDTQKMCDLSLILTTSSAYILLSCRTANRVGVLCYKWHPRMCYLSLILTTFSAHSLFYR